MRRLINIKILLSIIYILIICIFLWYFFSFFSLRDFSSYEIIRENQETLNRLKNTNLVLSCILFFIFCCVWCLLLGFGTPVFLLGGFIFGKWLGSVLVIIGLTCGATLLYLLGDFFLKDLVKQKFQKKFSYIIDKFKKNEFIYFIIYRLIGGIPFAIQNLLPVLFNIKLKIYFFGTLVGLSPQLFIGTTLGSGINNIITQNTKPPSFFDMIKSPDIYLPISALILIFILAFLFRRKFFKNDQTK